MGNPEQGSSKERFALGENARRALAHAADILEAEEYPVAARQVRDIRNARPTHEPAPDARCISTPDGDCISNDCMHTDPPPASAPPPPAEQWQSIDTAPKDGTPVLVCNSERGGAWIAYYNPVFPSGYTPENPWSSLMLNMWWHNSRLASTVPTHWQPIPAPCSTVTKCEGHSDG